MDVSAEIGDIVYYLKNRKIVEALERIEAYLVKDPDHFFIRLTKAEVLTDLRKYTKASEIYGELEKAYPSEPHLQLSLGKYYIAMRSFSKAVCCLEGYIQHGDKACRDVCLSLLVLAYSQNGDFNRAVFYSKLIQDPEKQRVAAICCGLMLPYIYPSVAAVSAHRKRIEDNLERIVHDTVIQIDGNQTDITLIFNVAYQGYNDKDFNSKYSDFIRRSLKILPVKEEVSTRSSGKIKIGFISALYHFHTIGKLTAGIYQFLPRSKYEVVLILMSEGVGDQVTERMKGLADHIVYFKDIQSGIDEVRSLHLDILFYSDIGMDPTTYLLAHYRLARVQCVTWGHPVTTGIATMDYFISSKLLEVPHAQEHYREKLVLLDVLPVLYYMVPESIHESTVQLPIPEGSHVYSCPQTLFKIHPEFDSWIGAILERDPKGVAIFIDRGDMMTTLLNQRFKRAMSKDAMDRVVFIEKLSQVDYLRLLRFSDVLLDPIHFGGGNSSFEAFAVGTPIVTCPSEYMRGRVTSGCYQQMGISQCIAKNKEEYVDIAVKLVTDTHFRQYIRKRIQVEKGKLFENLEVIKELDAFFQKAVAPAI